MGGFAAIVDLAGSPVDPGELAPVLAGIGAPGSTARTVSAGVSWIAFAAVPRTTIEDSLSVAATPPGAATPMLAAVDGWIDNRAELWDRLESDRPAPARQISGAELVLAGYRHWRDDFLAELVGPFAALLIDCNERTLSVVRDPLGGRSLFHRRLGTRVAIASRPSALLKLGGVTPPFDESSIARFFALRGPEPGATFFREIEEAIPGAIVELTRAGRRVTRQLRLAAAAPPGRGRETDYEGRFRELLDQAVARRLPARGGVAISMSGGLDSTSVAESAARHLSEAAPPVTVSWIFRELPEGDESRWIEAFNRAVRVRPVVFPADDLWPLSGEETWPRPIDTPFQDLYWRPRQQLLKEARTAGCSAVLNGEFGDELWLLGYDWLASLVRRGKLGAAARGVSRAISYSLRGQRIRHPLLGSLRRICFPAPPRRPAPAHPWLTTWAKERLEDPATELPCAAGAGCESDAPRPLLSPLRMAANAMSEQLAEPFGLDVRRPFRDQSLVEFFLGLPPHLIYRPGETKRLLRRAMADRLPSEVLHRTSAAAYPALADRGLAERGWPQLRSALERSEPLWSPYVQRDWLWSQGVGALGTRRDGIERLVLWQCFSIDRWHESLRRFLAAPFGVS